MGQGKATGGTDAGGDKKSDVEAREFADAVFASLDQMAAHETVLGLASTEAERLAAALIFLRTLTLEYARQVRSYPDAVQSERERERVRVAIEAIVLLQDVIRGRRHPVHKFFRGSAKRLQSRQVTSHDVTRECILIAAVGALVKAGVQQEMRPAAAIRLLKGHPSIGDHMPGEEAFTKIMSRREFESEYILRVQDNQEMMARSGDVTTAGVLNWTAMALSSRESPLDLAAATTVKQYGVVRHGADGSAVLMKPQRTPFQPLPSQRTIQARPLPMPPNLKGSRA